MKRFRITTPEKLRALAPFLLRGSVENVAAVWSATRRKQGACPWDGKIGIVFHDGSAKEAYIRRIDGGKEVRVADVLFDEALQWCQEHLEPLEVAGVR